MMYTYKVYYYNKTIRSWKNGENYKIIKAKSKKQAIEKFKSKFPPALEPYMAI